MKYIKLFENIENQKYIEELADLILLYMYNFNKDNDWNRHTYKSEFLKFINNYKDVYIHKISVVGKGFNREFQKFVKNSDVHIEIIRQIKGVDNGSYSNRDCCNYITLAYKEQDVNDILNGDEISSSNLQNIINLRRKTLVHELQHVFDDWRSNGKYFKKKYYGKTFGDVILHNPLSDYDVYAKSEHETSAFFTHIASEILSFNYNTKSIFDSYDLNKWDNVYSEFKKKMPLWDDLEPDIKKRLSRRLYVLWKDKIGTKKEEVDVTDKLKSLLQDLRSEFNDSIQIFYNKGSDKSIEIYEMKLKNIEEEKKVYKKIIWFADRYKKTILVHLYKNYNTVNIKEATKYLKEFGFVLNKGRNINYKYFTGKNSWYRKTKRK